jgi:hypothetical protein
MTNSTPIKEVGMSLMHWYSATPVVIVFGTVVFLTVPYLALAALTIAALVALAALTRAIVSVPFRLWTRHQSRVG